MMKKIAIMMLAAASTLASTAGDPYKIRVQLTDEDNGKTVYLRNYDTGEDVDSAVVADKVALMRGEVDEPFYAQLTFGGRKFAEVIVENGSIVVDAVKQHVFGSMLNDMYSEFSDQADAESAKIQAMEQGEARDAAIAAFYENVDSMMVANIDNPIGYSLFGDLAAGMETEEFMGYLEKYPQLKNYKRVQALMEIYKNRAATAPGNKYVDFEVTYDGKTQKLSDYVGNGKFLLVDFWASWCGPCVRQIPVIKELMAEFGDRLQVLGVAVWDDPKNTLKAIEKHGVTWPCLMDAQTVPTELYGITAIPCIMLIGPDGTILSRDKQGENLKAEVREAMGR